MGNGIKPTVYSHFTLGDMAAYYMLEKETDQPKKLLWAVILSNVVTTVGVALTERLLCRGFWV